MSLPATKKSRSNRDRWATTEFLEWTTERGLFGVERTLLDRYFSKDGKTLDAGTGGGRLPLAMREMGFTSLTGFDYLPEMLAAARAADPAGEITLDLQEATSLDYPSESFDQVTWVQLLGAVDSEGGPVAALREAHRVLRGPGVALISFLWWDPRQSHTVVRVFGPWLRAQRALRRSHRSDRDWPWLRLSHGRRYNLGALIDRGPYLHWFSSSEAQRLLEEAGFRIALPGGVAEAEALARGDDPRKAPTSELFFVCTKA